LDGNPRVLTICLSSAMHNDFVVLHKLLSFLRQIDQFGPKTKTKKEESNKVMHPIGTLYKMLQFFHLFIRHLTIRHLRKSLIFSIFIFRNHQLLKVCLKKMYWHFKTHGYWGLKARLGNRVISKVFGPLFIP
jgi:hypothetical protein